MGNMGMIFAAGSGREWAYWPASLRTSDSEENHRGESLSKVAKLTGCALVCMCVFWFFFRGVRWTACSPAGNFFPNELSQLYYKITP